jgi:uncharacterized protein (DUF2235 family)
MARNIVLCCDGTSNQPAHDMTNVLKLYFALAHDSAAQLTYYHPGLGTMEPPGALSVTEKFVTTKLGLAMGRGLADDIRDAYVYLCDTYRPGDNVYLFGFSRGAYTARAIASLVNMYGLIEPGNAPLAPYAIRMMFAINRANQRHDEDAANNVFHLARRFRDTFERPCTIRFVGVWDTVSSVGWFAHPSKLPYTASNPSVAISRHAIAIDERRAFFPPNLWRPDARESSGPKDLKQVWFPGSHSDVGGGYPEGPESAQSKYPLEWMMVEARKAGLLFDQKRIDIVLGRTADPAYVKAAVDQPVHETLTGWWRLTEFLPKPHYDYATKSEHWRANLFRKRSMPEGALVHESAYLRGEGYFKPRLPAGAVQVPHEAA